MGNFLSWCLSHRVVDLPYCATYQKEKVNLLSQFVIALHNCISVATNTDFREESIYNIIRDRDYTNAKANAKKYVYFCVCFGIIYTDRNDTGSLQHEGKSIFRIFRR